MTTTPTATDTAGEPAARVDAECVSVARSVWAEQVQQLFSQLATGLRVNLAVGAVVGWLLWGNASSAALAVWLAALVMVTWLRARLGRAYRAAAAVAADPDRWARRFLVLSTASGLIWGMAVPLFGPALRLEQQALFALVIAGMCAGAVGALGSVFRVYLAYVLGAIVPATAWFLMMASEFHVAAGALSVIFVGALVVISRNHARRLCRSLTLGFENQALASELETAKERAEHTAARLAAEAEERRRAERLMAHEKAVLEQIAQKRPLASLLERINHATEDQFPDVRSSILLLDAGRSRLVHGSAPSLPDAYNRCVDGLEIGPAAGSCGSAAYLNRPVIVADVHDDPRWAPYRDVARSHDIGACWSWPIRRSTGSVLGTFALYRRLPGEPGLETVNAVERLSQLASIAIERHEADSALRHSEERFRSAFDNASIGMALVAMDQTILEANRPFCAMLRYEPGQIEGMDLGALTHPDDRELCREQHQRLFRGDISSYRLEKRFLQIDEQPVWGLLSVSSVRGPEGEQRYAIAQIQDVTEARELSEQLTHQATHDSLTGLANRSAFEQRLAQMLDQARAGRVRHALCYLDLDQFKVINDTCGHVAGDELLRQLSGVLQTRVRRTDCLARLGGDEFGVLVERCELEEAKRVAGALADAVDQFRFRWQDKTFVVGVSIGLVPIVPETESLAAVLGAADAACYAAKEQGRNRIHVFEPDDAELARRHGEMQWVARIDQALDENRFCLMAQPIVPVDPARRGGDHYELLLRMVGDDGLVPPGAFLPAAERYNVATRLDRWVVDHALRWLSDHPEQLRRLELCSINLSGQSIADSGFRDFLVALLEAGGVPASKICFEITETAAIANLNSAVGFIETLQGLGCRFALDDFGSGLSSFAYLKTLPVDFLKIDGVFVRDIANDPIDRAMVRSINAIGQVMGKRTIAEFVENDEILCSLREIGVDYAQGYGIGRPRPLESLVEAPADASRRSADSSAEAEVAVHEIGARAL